MKKYTDNRDDQMIGDALGTLQGRIDKGTVTLANCSPHYYYGNLSEPKLPAVEANQWYAKIDVTSMPSFKQQAGRGTPRVVLLIDNGAATGPAYFSAHHYAGFDELGEGFAKRGAAMRAYCAK